MREGAREEEEIGKTEKIDKVLSIDRMRFLSLLYL